MTMQQYESKQTGVRVSRRSGFHLFLDHLGKRKRNQVYRNEVYAELAHEYIHALFTNMTHCCQGIRCTLPLVLVNKKDRCGRTMHMKKGSKLYVRIDYRVEEKNFTDQDFQDHLAYAENVAGERYFIGGGFQTQMEE